LDVINTIKDSLACILEPEKWFKAAYDSSKDVLFQKNNLHSMRNAYLQSTQTQLAEESKQKDFVFLQKRTRFSMEELEYLHEEFLKATSSSLTGNGLDIYDFYAVMRSISPNWSKVSLSVIKKLFNHFDTSRAGVLHYHELVVGLDPIMKGPVDKMLQLFFVLFAEDTGGGRVWLTSDKNFRSVLECVYTIYTGSAEGATASNFDALSDDQSLTDALSLLITTPTSFVQPSDSADDTDPLALSARSSHWNDGDEDVGEPAEKVLSSEEFQQEMSSSHPQLLDVLRDFFLTPVLKPSSPQTYAMISDIL